MLMNEYKIKNSKTKTNKIVFKNKSKLLFINDVARLL
jgi:hypothetical protein